MERNANELNSYTDKLYVGSNPPPTEMYLMCPGFSVLLVS